MNGGIYSTGNEIVDENAKLNISGNIIPQVWYRTIIRESGKPNLTAIIILADIVYWYKPTEIRDEGTGQVIGVRKKFKSDLLQRSYQQISEQFGISKKEATNAVVFLEKLGVVKRVFRTISMNGIVVNNVLYLELIVDRLKELTYPEETGADPVSFEKRREKSKAEKISPHTVIEEEIHFVEERAVPFQRERVSPFKEGAYPDRETEPWIPKEVPQTDSGQTNTEITTKTTAESTQKNTTEIGNGYRDNPILSYQAAEEQFKDQIDYDAIWIDRPFDRKLLNEIVGIAVDVLTSNAKTIRVNQEERPLGIVQGMYKKLDKFTVEYVIDSIKQPVGFQTDQFGRRSIRPPGDGGRVLRQLPGRYGFVDALPPGDGADGTRRQLFRPARDVVRHRAGEDSAADLARQQTAGPGAAPLQQLRGPLGSAAGRRTARDRHCTALSDPFARSLARLHAGPSGYGQRRPTRE